MKRILKHVLTLIFIIFLHGTQQAFCQISNVFDSLTYVSFAKFIEWNLLHRDRDFKKKTIEYISLEQPIEGYVDYMLANLPKYSKIEKKHNRLYSKLLMDSITKFHVPDIFWFDKNCLLSMGGEYARYERYIQPDKNIRKLLRMGITGAWMYPIVLQRDTLVVGFDIIKENRDYIRYIFGTELNYTYKYDSITRRWLFVQYDYEYNWINNYSKPDELCSIINGCLYSYLSLNKSCLSEHIYVITDGYSRHSSIRMDFQFEDIQCEQFYLDNINRMRGHKEIAGGLDAVVLDELVLQGDELRLTFVRKHIFLNEDRSSYLFELYRDSKKTYYYKYSSEHEKWRFIKEE